MRYAVLAVFFVEMDNCFCIAVAAVSMAEIFEPLTKFLMIINFTVEDYKDRIIFIHYRLMPGLHINDAQPAHCNTDVTRKVEAGVIGPSMDDPAVHFPESALFGCPVAIEVKNAADSAHS